MEKSKRKLLGLGVFFILAGLAYAAYWQFYARFSESTDDAYVYGNLVQVMPKISGDVISIHADETQWVKEGEILVKLDDKDAIIALDKATAGLAETVRNVRQLYSAANEMKAGIDLKEAELEKATEDLKRRETPAAEHSISQEEYRHAKNSLAVAQSSLDLAREKLKGTLALTENTALKNHPSVLKAEAKVREAYLTKSRGSIISPVTGFVAKRSVQIGQHVTPGLPLMVIVPLDQVWVDANFKEDQLSDIRIGQNATLTSDFYGKQQRFHGKVAGLGAGTGSVFSLLPPQNATGNWIKIVQRLPVRIILDQNQLTEHPLRIGLSMAVSVDIKDRSGTALSSAPKMLPPPVSEKPDNGADKLIEKIIKDNS